MTLKIRTGWDAQNKNGVEIAKIAEQMGIQSLAVHGRTRACRFKGEVEYDTIAQIKQAVSIPVVANGDIDSAQKAKQILDYTGADGLMIGRAAQGRPWIFREINHYLQTGELLKPISMLEIESILLGHIAALHEFYGELQGVRVARKHLAWYLLGDESAKPISKVFNQIVSAKRQLDFLTSYFKQMKIEKAQVA